MRERAVGRRVAVCVVGAVAFASVGIASAENPPGFVFTSTPIAGTQPPGDASSAADAAAGTTSGASVVLFAGDEGETWVYDAAAGSWSKETPLNTPAPRTAEAMAPAPPNAGADRALLYGGFTPSPDTYLDDTWIWNTTTAGWTKACDGCAPGGLARAMMAASPSTTLLVDGSISAGFVNAVWRWDDASSNWIEVHPSAPDGFPAPRGDAQFAFDGINFVLYGGLSNAFQSFADTWLLIDEGGGSFRWELACSQCPPGPRSLGAFTPMGGAGTPAGAVLVGGELIDAQQQPATKYYSDTWFWDGTARSWLQLVPGSPLTPSSTDPNVPYSPSGGSTGGVGEQAAGIVLDTRFLAAAEDSRVESNVLRWALPVPPAPPSPPPAPPISVAPRFTG